jgi:NAD(P)-dependent dehydrogenase (short-subunit alcohol dehydrogenase family)
MFAFTPEQRFIVTGASAGIGEGVALLLNSLGATVIAVGRNVDRLAAMREKSAYPERMLLEPKDLAEHVESLPDWIKSLKEKYGKFQGMACCAGLGGISPLRAVTSEEIRRMFEINYFANVFLAQGFADKRNNNGRGSAIVCIASSGGMRTWPGMTSYAGSKGALIATMQSIARELAPVGIRVNCVSPTLIDTDMADETSRAFAEGKYPLGIGAVEDVANMVGYLLSDKAKWITVQNYVIDCGAV